MDTPTELHVWGISGQEVAHIPREQLSTVRALKQHLQKLCGCSRFRQRLTHHGTALDDDARLDSQVEATDVQLVVVPFCETSEGQAYELREEAWADNVVEVERLLQRPQDPNFQHDDGTTTNLSMATEMGHLEIVRLLLEAGARIERSAINAFVGAACKGHIEIVRLLLEAGADKDAWDDDGMTVLAAATAGGQLAIVRLLLDSGARVEWSTSRALVNAARRGHIDLVRLFVEFCADKEAWDGHDTLLSAAISGGHVETARLLLEAGAGIDGYANRALVFAARQGYIDTIRFLLEAGANKDAWDERDTLLSAARKSRQKELARFLQEAGACDVWWR